MIFITWNVNGLRACLNKGFLDFFKSTDADIFAIQETKLSDGLQLELPGYNQYWNNAVKKGYSGTAVFSKQTPLRATFGIGKPEHDNEGRVITLEFETFFFVTVYTPNSQHQLARLDYRLSWEDDFRDYICGLDSNKPVIICGDMNVAHKEIDLKNPSSNRNNAGFTDAERQKFSQLLDAGFCDSFRYLYPDLKGAYTWWSYMFNARANNAGWRIDYFLVSERIKHKIKDCSILSNIMGSDHCPVEFRLSDE